MTTQRGSGITTVDPSTGRVLAEYEMPGPGDVQPVLDTAVRAFEQWRSRPVGERAVIVGAVAEALEGAAEELSRQLTAEMGKPLTAARAEVAKCAAAARWVAAEGPRILAPEEREDDDGRAWVRRDPLGVVLAVMPWNFPYWQSLRFALPALVAGNVGVVKAAPVTAGSALLLQRALDASGLPEGVLQTVLWSNDAVAAAIADDRVAGVTLTGSERAGSAVASTAGTHLKKTVLELGGSDPFLVLPGADVAAAAETAAASRFQNCGQSCIAAKRLIVHADLAEEFTVELVRHARALVVGDPRREDVTVGPLATVAARDAVAQQVAEAVRDGARVVTGGSVVEGPGAFYQPTVLADVLPGSPTAVSEVFGPVASVMVARDVAHAVELANDSSFGLAATVFTDDTDLALSIAERLEVGQVFVNSMVRSEARFPFGGVKRSGFGRELGPEGFTEFVNLKLVRVAAR